MSNEFRNHVDQLINSLKENLSDIHYQAFDFTNVNDSRSELTKLNYDKSKVSCLNFEMIADMFQIFAAVHSAIEQPSSRDFSVEVPYRLANTRSIGDALRTFGGYGKPYMIIVCIDNRSNSEELFEKISRIEHVKKMSDEQMKLCMKNNQENIRKYYFGTVKDDDEVFQRNPIGEIVTQMIISKNL